MRLFRHLISVQQRCIFVYEKRNVLMRKTFLGYMFSGYSTSHCWRRPEYLCDGLGCYFAVLVASMIQPWTLQLVVF